MATSDLALLVYLLTKWAQVQGAHFRAIARSTGSEVAFAIACFIANKIEEYQAHAKEVSVRDFVDNLQIAYSYWEHN